MAEGGLRSGQIELPHPAEAFVVNLERFLAPRHKAPPPFAQRLGVVKTQDFDICHHQAGRFHRGGHFAQGRDVAAGEDIFGDPGVGRRRRIESADGVDQRHAVLCEQPVHVSEILRIVTDAHMLEHAHRDDAIETRFEQAIVLQAELHQI